MKQGSALSPISYEEDPDSRLIYPLQLELFQLICFQNQVVVLLVQSHQKVRDEIIVKIELQKINFIEVVGDMK